MFFLKSEKKHKIRILEHWPEVWGNAVQCRVGQKRHSVTSAGRWRC